MGALLQSMGQHALDVATMDIPNATVFNLADNLHADKVASIYNSVELDQTSLPLGATLHTTQLVMHIPPSPPDCFFQWPARNIAWFDMPEQYIKHGMNKFELVADLNVMENTDDFVHWAFATTLGAFPNGTDIYIAGQPKLSSLGIFNMDLKIGKKLKCTYIVPDASTTAIHKNPPADYSKAFEEFVTAGSLAGGMGPVSLSCEYNGNLDADLLDTILQNFTDELAHPVTTSTEAPTTLAPASSTAAPGPAATTLAPTTAASIVV